MEHNKEKHTDHHTQDAHCPNCHHGHGERESQPKSDSENLYEALAQDAWFPDFYALDQEDDQADALYDDGADNDVKIYEP